MAKVVCASCGSEQPEPRHTSWCPKVLGAPRAPPPFCYDVVYYQGVPISFDPTLEQMINLERHCRARQAQLIGQAWMGCFPREQWDRIFDGYLEKRGLGV